MPRVQVELQQRNMGTQTPQASALADARQTLLQARKHLRATAAEARRLEDAIVAAQEACRVAQLELDALEAQVSGGSEESSVLAR